MYRRKLLLEAIDTQDGRRIYSVDVGDLPFEKAKQYIDQIIRTKNVSDQ